MDWHVLSVFERLIVIIGYIALGIIIYLTIVFAVAFVIILAEDLCEKYRQWRRMKQKQQAAKPITAIPRKVRYNWKGKIY